MSRAKMVKIKKEAIKAWLEVRDIKQYELAEALGTNASYLSKAIKRGSISEYYLDLIAEYLEIPNYFLLDIDSSPTRRQEEIEGFPFVFAGLADGKNVSCCYVRTDPGTYASVDTVIRIAYRLGYASRIQEILIEEAVRAAKEPQDPEGSQHII